MTRVRTYFCDFSTLGLPTAGEDSTHRTTAFSPWYTKVTSIALYGTFIKTGSEGHIFNVSPKRQVLKRWQNAGEMDPGWERTLCYWWPCSQREVWEHPSFPLSHYFLLLAMRWVVLLNHVIPSPPYLTIGTKQWGHPTVHWAKLRTLSSEIRRKPTNNTYDIGVHTDVCVL